MTLEKDHDEKKRQVELALVNSVCNKIRDHLEIERHRIYEEVRNYPTPIAACDAQFNYLLEDCSRV